MNERGEMNGNILCGQIKGYNNSIAAIMCVKQVGIALVKEQHCGWVVIAECSVEYLQSSSTLDTFLLKNTICSFNKCVDKTLNVKRVRSFVNIPLSVKYNKTLKALATVVLFVWKYTALGESHITNTPLSFAFCYVYLPLNSHLN